jgi:hypothetical protein
VARCQDIRAECEKEKLRSHTLQRSLKRSKKEDIFTNNDQMLLFDGSIIHAVGYTSNPQGNLRLIFSFLDQHQIYDGIEHYEKINRWKKIINS